MTYGAFTQDFAPFERARRPETSNALPILCAATLTLSATVGLWALYAPQFNRSGFEAADPAPPAQTSQITSQFTSQATMTPAPAAIAPLRQYAGLLDPSLAGRKPLGFAQSAPLRAGFEPLRHRQLAAVAAPVELRPVDLRSSDLRSSDLHSADLRPSDVDIDTDTDTKTASLDMPGSQPQVVPALPNVSEVVRDVPLPAPRPRFEAEDGAAPGATPPVLAAPRRVASQSTARDTAETPAPAAPAGPGFFDKLFGKSQPQPGTTALAYAAPQESMIGNLFAGRPAATASPDRVTAVYDISAHTVYMPDGSQLEAHSGLGEAFDNPNGVHLRMRGATPPNVYELTQREALFHGVRALRLTPTGGTTYGRGGLLAHTYMLRGGTGESNGCVVFRNYAAFLRAYDNGQIKRLAVVARRT